MFVFFYFRLLDVNWSLCCWAAFCSAISTRSLYWPNPWWWLAQFKGYASGRDSQSSTALSSPKPTAFHAYLIRYLHLFINTHRPFQLSFIFRKCTQKASRSAKRPSFISPKSQMVITSCIISFQVLFFLFLLLLFLNDFYYLVFWLPFWNERCWGPFCGCGWSRRA